MPTPDGRPGAVLKFHVPGFRKDRVEALEKANKEQADKFQRLSLEYDHTKDRLSQAELTAMCRAVDELVEQGSATKAKAEPLKEVTLRVKVIHARRSGKFIDTRIRHIEKMLKPAFSRNLRCCISRSPWSG